MKSKKCERCGYVCAETAEACKSCGSSFSSESSSWFTTATGSASSVGSARHKKLAQASLAAAFAALVWSQLHERLGPFADLLAIVLFVSGLVTAIVALLKIRNNPFLFGGKRLAQSALAASGVFVMLYAMAIPSLIVKRKAPAVVWKVYESEEGKFSIKMPGVAQHKLQYVDATNRQMPMHFAEIDLGPEGACVSGYVDFSDFNIAASPDTLLDATVWRSEKFGEMTRVSHKEISLYGYKGREIVLQPSSIKYGKNTFAIARAFVIPPRMYLNMIAGPTSGELDQHKTEFLDSFHIFNTPLIEALESGKLTDQLWLNTDQRDREFAFVRFARKGSKETLRRLHDADVSINAKDDLGRTALMMAAAYSTPVDTRVESCVTFLIGRGANLDVQDNDRQWTALDWSIVEGGGNAALALIKAGADVNLKDRNGETALMHAKKLGRPDLVDALLKAGARE
jgi:hypothetical protein